MRLLLLKENDVSLDRSKENLNSFEEIFGRNGEPIRHFQAPARINIIGEHVDYLGGIVLPAAINFSVDAWIRPNQREEYRFHSVSFSQTVNAKHPLAPLPNAHWADYILGVLVEIEKHGKSIPGFDLLIDGNIPQGAGLSSSAALEVVAGYSINEIFSLGLSSKEIALIGQSAENNFVGTKCGIMDQFVIAHGKKNHCLSLNTSSLEFTYHNFELGDYEFYLINSNVKHSLKDSAYNTRREECEAALKKIQKTYPQYKNLYDVKLDPNELVSYGLTENETKRTQHVLSERERTKQVIQGLESGDLNLVGEKLFEAHKSLSKSFEVSCEEMDFLADSLKSFGALGARMIGGGFGGCLLVLDKKENFSQIEPQIKKSYQQKYGLPLNFYKFEISDGVKEVNK